jgi:hypothetical protein
VGLKKEDDVTPTLRKLHWLLVGYRILYNILLLTFKSINGYDPDYLKEIIHKYVPPCALRSETENRLQVPKSQYILTQKRAFGVRAPVEWNQLPCHLRHIDNVEAFKTALKTYFFKMAYD